MTRTHILANAQTHHSKIRKCENAQPVDGETDLEELACLVHLPTDLLYVKESVSKEEEEDEVEESKDITDEQSAGYAIFAKKDLKADAILAKYKGHFRIGSQVLDSGDDGSYLKFNCLESGTSVHVMVEDDGHWLKLIRKATSTSEANICLRITCSDVVCRVAKDVNRDGELKVTCEISDHSASDKRSDRAFDQTHQRCLNDEHGEDSESLSGGVSDVRTRRASDMLDTPTGAQDSEERESDGVSVKTEDCQDNKISYEEDYHNRSSDINTRSTRGNEILENVVSPSSDPDRPDSANRNLREGKEIGPLKSSKVPSFDADETSSRSPNIGCDERLTEQLYECPFCAFQTNKYSTLSKHTKSQHMSSDKDKFSSDPASSESAYCEACSIQFMSAKTYRVHKAFYCKSRHEPLPSDVRQLSSETDSREDMFVLGKKHLGEQYHSTNGMVPNVIHPRAIFAAISTDPLILLPCSLVNGQGLVPQNGLISTGVPIVLPTGIPSTAIVENGSSPSLQLNQTRDRTNKAATVSASSQPSTEVKSGIMDYSDDSADKNFDDVDVLNLSKSEEKTLRKVKTNPDISQDGPLDLTIRKRKTSCFEVNRSEPRPVAKRRNSCASVTPTTPPVQHSSSLPKKRLSFSPEASYQANHHSSHLLPQVAAVSPPAFSNDASSSSGFGPSSAPNLTVNDVHGLCNVREGSSPTPPVLLSVLETATNSNSLRSTIPYSLPPPKLLKQGNNRCEDCNIVFYKYDNYLAHKNHYCAYRRQQLANQMKEELARASSDASSSDDNSRNTAQSEPANYDEKPAGKLLNQHLDFAFENLVTVQPTGVNKPSPSAVFRCDACGVKFSTADNLNAHQTYYCSQKVNFPYPKCNNNNSLRKNSKSRDESAQSCPTCGESSESHEELCCPEEWKCNYCDIVCPSLKTARKHLLTHSEIRGFCCIMCGYRGNTLRGMRGHVYEHLNGDASQIEDILASSVVVDHVASGRRTADFSGNEESCGLVSRESEQMLDESKDPRFNTRQENSDECSRSPPRSTHVASPDVSGSEEKDSQVVKKSPYMKEEPECHERQLIEESDGSEMSPHVPSVMCDVLIKTETEECPSSPERIVPERECPSFETSDFPPAFCHIKEDPVSPQNMHEIQDGQESEEDEEIDVEKEVDKIDIKTEAPVTSAATSVICRVSSCRDGNKVNTEITKEPLNINNPMPKKRKLKTNVKPGVELKYCKSCDITFHHLANFIAHKKFYCVSRVVGNFQQEAAPVQ